MFNHIERKDIIFILVMLAFIIGGIWFYADKASFRTLYGFDRQPIKSDRVQSNKGKVASSQGSNKNNISKAEQQYLQKFEDSLNAFLGSIYAQMDEYRKRRKILADALRPENLQNATYIEEGYALVMQTIPDLTQRSEDIIQSFNKKDADIRALIKNRPPAAQKNVWQAWEKVKREQGTLFVEYFSIEQDILGSYEALMYHYFQNKDQVQYNASLDTVSFENAELNAKTAQLKNAIESLKKQQMALTE